MGKTKTGLEKILSQLGMQGRANYVYRHAGESDIPQAAIDESIAFFQVRYPLTAAHIAHKVGQLETEFDLLARGEDYTRALKLGRKERFYDKTVELYRQLERFLEGAEFAVDNGHPDEGIELYIKGKSFLSAILLAEKTGQHEWCMSLLEREGQFERAARLAARHGEIQRSTRDYLRAGMPGNAIATARRAGADELTLELLESYDSPVQAGIHAEMKGFPARAVRNYIKTDHLNDAFRVFNCVEEMTDELKGEGDNLRVRLENKGDYQRAGDVAEKLGQTKLAKSYRFLETIAVQGAR
ncbi:MAG: hypothetical protein AABX51_03910 [Nanoarchaeota archaeon]